MLDFERVGEVPFGDRFHAEDLSGTPPGPTRPMCHAYRALARRPVSESVAETDAEAFSTLVK